MADIIDAIINWVDKESNGEMTIFRASEMEDSYKERISTGSIGLDCVTGGGLPWGFTQYIGPESAGKTFMGLKAAIEAQKQDPGAKIAYVAVEAPLDKTWSRKVGIDLNDNFIVLRASSGENYLNLIKKVIDSEEFRLVIIDSIPALATTADLEGSLGDRQVGDRARMVSQFVRHCVYNAKSSDPKSVNKTSVLGINQFYVNIGGFSPRGTPRAQHGGSALKYAKLIDVEFTSGQPISEGTAENRVVYGKQIKYKVIKGKAGCSEGGVGAFDFYNRDYKENQSGKIDEAKEYRIIALKYGVFQRRGPYTGYDDTNYKNADLEESIRTDPAFKEELRNKIYEAAGINVVDKES